MEKLDIVLWAMGGGYVVLAAILRAMWGRFDKVDERINDIDRRLCRIEGAMSRQDCCALKNSHQDKAE